jgi:hypothetical protein
VNLNASRGFALFGGGGCYTRQVEVARECGEFQLALDKFQTNVITELVRFSGMFIVCLRWVDVDTHTILLWLIIGLSG